jgi:hypothetical protein
MRSEVKRTSRVTEAVEPSFNTVGECPRGRATTRNLFPAPDMKKFKLSAERAVAKNSRNYLFETIIIGSNVWMFIPAKSF